MAAEEAAAAALQETHDLEADGTRDDDDMSSLHSVHMVNDQRTMEEEGEEQEEAEVDAPRGEHAQSVQGPGSVGAMSHRDNQTAAGSTIVSVQSSRVSVGQSYVTATSTVMEAQEILPTIAVLLNYVTVLIRTESFTQLKQSFDMRNYVYQLLELLSDKERERLDNGVVNAVHNMEVMCYEKPRDCIEPVIREIVHRHAAEARRIEEERQRMIDAELAAQSLQDEGSMKSSVVSLTKSQIRHEQKLRHAEQRRLDAIKRNETSKQRKMLYELIQSDQITAIFNARAEKKTLAHAPKWGSVKDMDLDEKDKGFSGLAATLSSKPSSVMKSTKSEATISSKV